MPPAGDQDAVDRSILEAPFQNWTRAGSDLLGTVFLYADYRVPVDEVRQELERFVTAETARFAKVVAQAGVAGSE